MKLNNCGKLEVRRSEIEGFGVFATDFIPKGSILEETPFIIIPENAKLGKGMYEYLSTSEWISQYAKFSDSLRLNLGFKNPEKYYFKWTPPHQPFPDKPIEFTVLPLGNGCIYNSSNTKNNAGWLIKDKLFIFRAESDIAKDEEIMTFYGYFLSESGTIYNCEDVFFLALDKSEDSVKLKTFRFPSMQLLEESRNHPSYINGDTHIKASKVGLTILSISSTNRSMEDQKSITIPSNASIDFIYSRLSESKKSGLAFSRIHVGYKKIDDDKTIQDVLIFKNF